MNNRVSPWSKPGSSQLRDMLAGDPATDTILTRILDQLGLDETAALAGLVRNAVTEAMHDAGHVARHECLDAVQAVVDEIEGKQR